MRVCALLPLLALIAACGGGEPIADVELSLTISVDADEVEFGRGFPLTVVRTWSKDLLPKEWDEELLAPLAVRLEETVTREDDLRTEETFRYEAFAFSRGEVAIPAPEFRAVSRTGGGERRTTGNPVFLRVASALDPAEPGDAEYPDGPLREPLAWTVPAACGVLALAGMALLLIRFLRRPGAPATALPAKAPGPPPPDPGDVALEKLAKLRKLVSGGREEVVALHLELARILRAYLASGLRMRAERMTTEECLAALKGQEAMPHLARAFGACDLVKFARYLPAVDAREGAIEAAEQFVRGAGPGAGPGDGGA